MINQHPNGTYYVEILLPVGFQIKSREFSELYSWVNDNKINGCRLSYDPEIVFGSDGHFYQNYTVFTPTTDLAIEAKLRFA